MKSLSINLPDNIFKASSKAAKKIGLSRTAFIRRAIVHELEEFESELEQKAIVDSLNAMKKSKEYMAELEEIDSGFASSLPEEKKEWWK
jgi:predicted transcriptional regulator